MFDIYYDAISKSNENGNSNIFVEFMLNVILQALVGINVGIKSRDKIINLLEKEPSLTAEQLANELQIAKRQVERLLAELKANNRIKRIGSNKTGHWVVINKK